MFRVRTACGLLGCGLFLSSLGYSARNNPDIAVFLEFESKPSPSAVAAMEREIGEIMKPSGLRFEYRLMEDRKSGESFSDLVVIKFKGTCQTVQPARYNELGPIREGAPLAFTVISDGKILPFSDVECDTIREYIAPSVGAKSQDRRDALLGRALGRVVAHELYHIFADTTGHASEGVARSFHTRKELTANEFHFTEHENRILHDVKARQSGAAYATSVDLSESAR